LAFHEVVERLRCTDDHSTSDNGTIGLVSVCPNVVVCKKTVFKDTTVVLVQHESFVVVSKHRLMTNHSLLKGLVRRTGGTDAKSSNHLGEVGSPLVWHRLSSTVPRGLHEGSKSGQRCALTPLSPGSIQKPEPAPPAETLEIGSSVRFHSQNEAGSKCHAFLRIYVSLLFCLRLCAGRCHSRGWLKWCWVLVK